MRETVFISGEVDLRINIYRGQINAYSVDKVNNDSQISIGGTDNTDKILENCQNNADKLPAKGQEQLIYKYVFANKDVVENYIIQLLNKKTVETICLLSRIK